MFQVHYAATSVYPVQNKAFLIESTKVRVEEDDYDEDDDERKSFIMLRLRLSISIYP